MVPASLTFTVDFKPVPWKRPAGKTVRYDSQVNDKAAFTLKALKALHAAYPAIRAATTPWYKSEHLIVDITCVFAETSAKKNGLVGLPDVDNLAKFVLDAMQSQYMDSIVWNDDAQVVGLSVRKCFGEKDAVSVTIRRI